VAPEGVLPPKQERSRVTYERILDACEHLLRTRRFDEISVNDLCIEAEVSSSSLYGRFATKDAILLALSDRFRRRARAAIDEGIDVVHRVSSGTDFAMGAREVLMTYLSWCRTNGHLESAINLDPAAKQQIRAAEDAALRDAVHLVVSIFGSDDPSLARRAEIAILVAAAGTKRAVGDGAAWASRIGISDEELVSELVLMMGCYLGSAGDTGTGSSRGHGLSSPSG